MKQMKIERAIEILDRLSDALNGDAEIVVACMMGMATLRRAIPCKPDFLKENDVKDPKKRFISTFTTRCGCCHQIYETILPRYFYPFCPTCGQRQAQVEDDAP